MWEIDWKQNYKLTLNKELKEYYKVHEELIANSLWLIGLSLSIFNKLVESMILMGSFKVHDSKMVKNLSLSLHNIAKDLKDIHDNGLSDNKLSSAMNNAGFGLR